MRTITQLLEDKGREVMSIGADASVIDAIRLMAERGIGALLVMRGEAVEGIVSERDYARKVILHGRSSNSTQVREIMSSPVYSVSPDTGVHDCMRLMTERRIRHLPVMEGDRVVGMLSIGDLVRAVIADQQREISQLQQYIAG